MCINHNTVVDNFINVINVNRSMNKTKYVEKKKRQLFDRLMELEE